MNNWKDFFRDQRGNFNVFTCIALASAFEMLVMIPTGRFMGWVILTQNELYMLVLLYLIAAVGDYLLGIFLNKMPNSVTQIGDQNNLGAASDNSNGPINPPSTPDETQIPHPIEPVSPGAD